MDTYTVLVKPVETNRLILRKFVEGDEISIFNEYCGDRESSKYLQRLPHANIEQTKCMFENWSGQNGRIMIKILLGLLASAKPI